MQFPSQHFYEGRLQDAPAIALRPPAPYYDHPLLKPYVFFDVAKGRERRREGGGSLSNRVRVSLPVAGWGRAAAERRGRGTWYVCAPCGPLTMR